MTSRRLQRRIRERQRRTGESYTVARAYLLGVRSVVHLDPAVPHSARIWDYWLGGKSNYAADREMGSKLLGLVPELVVSARASRRFLEQAIGFLADEQGVRQFLDVGMGLPTPENTHDIAQRIAPESRVVYFDNDPIVLPHARALLSSTPEGALDFVDCDARDPERLLMSSASTLDFSQPIGVMMLCVLDFVPDDEVARSIVHRLMRVLAPGSYLAVSHLTPEIAPDQMARVVRCWNEQGAAPMRLRSVAELLGLFEGLELVEPGVVSCSRWRPGGEPAIDVPHFCGVARKL